MILKYYQLFLMDSIIFLIQPIHKLEIYLKSKDLVYKQMDNDFISPARAKEIILKLQEEIPALENQKQAKLYIANIWNKIPELKSMPKLYSMDLHEKYDNIIIQVIDSLMEKWDIETASKLLEETKNIKYNDMINNIRREYPDEFQKSIRDIAIKSKPKQS